jgi:phosphate:Na+ symporter
MPENLSSRLPSALRVSRYYSEAAELAESVAAARAKGEQIKRPELIEEIRAFEAQVYQLVGNADSSSSDYFKEAYQQLIQQTIEEYQSLKSRLLKAGAEGLIAVRPLVDELDVLSNVRRIGEQIEKGTRYLAELTGSPSAQEKG